MLTEIDKNKIREEELYRFEFRNSLLDAKPQYSRKEKLINFLNTNLGLFLLSTIFISGFTWAYNSCKYIVIENRIQQKNSKQLLVEIKNRLGCISKIGEDYPGEERVLIRTAIFGLNGGNYDTSSPKPAYSPIYMEYKERSLLSLLIELKEIFAENKEELNEKKIDTAIQVTKHLPTYFWKSYVDEKDSVSYYRLREITKIEFKKDLKKIVVD